MKTALITTSINVPNVLALYRRFDLSASVKFFCASDHKTPVVDTYNLCTNLGNCDLLTVERQKTLNYECSELIGWNCIQRRNIALLEALRWGADVIISCDDDNAPMDPNYFAQFRWLLARETDESVETRKWSGLKVAKGGWFDVGIWQFPRDGIDPVCQRGFPQARMGVQDLVFGVDAKIGVAQGICLGNPDTSAVDRMSRHPQVHVISEVLKAGVVVDPTDVWTIFNSQNTGIIRELAPAWSMWCGVARYDDIMASLVVQRVMRDRGYHVHYGRPLVYQQRNSHDTLKDLQGEMWGMEHIGKVATTLDQIELPGTSVLDDTRKIFDKLATLDWMPKQTVEAALAFLDDAEAVL